MAEFEIEFMRPSSFRCECCDGLVVRATRFVYQGGDAFGVCYLTYTVPHPDEGAELLVSLGEWGDDGSPADRVAFYCRTWTTDESNAVSLGDAASSVWADVELVGRKLSRKEALEHPWKADVFRIVDLAFERDVLLRGALQRMGCADPAVPLERSHGLPDELFGLPPEDNERFQAGRNFAVLDDERFFVRCLLPVPVEHYETWCIGVWAEVAEADYRRTRDVWDIDEAYSALSFPGRLANDLSGILDRQIKVGCPVRVFASRPDEGLKVAAVGGGALGAVLAGTWGREAFEAYALERGLL